VLSVERAMTSAHPELTPYAIRHRIVRFALTSSHRADRFRHGLLDHVPALGCVAILARAHLGSVSRRSFRTHRFVFAAALHSRQGA
jgi:hypothetical protein